MGTTGSSDQAQLNQELPNLVSRVRQNSSAYLAVGFGVSNRAHFDYVAQAGADGVVVGSKIVSVVKSASANEIPKKVEEYCTSISGTTATATATATSALDKIADEAAKVIEITNSQASSPPRTLPQLSSLPARFGEFGGQYVPEALVDCLVELEEAHKKACADPEFWKEFESFYGYINRPSKLYYAERLTQEAGGAKIWLKREDL
jgi:tryptophan synthase